MPSGPSPCLISAAPPSAPAFGLVLVCKGELGKKDMRGPDDKCSAAKMHLGRAVLVDHQQRGLVVGIRRGAHGARFPGRGSEAVGAVFVVVVECGGCILRE